jgi:hypothetical protein
MRLILVVGPFIPLEALRKDPPPGVSVGPVCRYHKRAPNCYVVVMATTTERMEAFIAQEGLYAEDFAGYRQIAPVRPEATLLCLPDGE